MREIQAALQALLREQLGSHVEVDECHPAGEGHGVRRWLLRADGQAYFAKSTAAAQADTLAAEADGLAALQASGCIRVPAVITRGVHEEQALLVLEHLELAPLREAAHGAALAEALAALHRSGGEAYGWARDNYIGASPQSNRNHPQWWQFFAEERLRPQFRRLQASGLDPALARAGERLLDGMAALLHGHQPEAVLLHGDLWHGNTGVLPDGSPVLFDPAVYRGDREADIAMSELFGGFPDRFYLEYRRLAPLADGFEQRKPLYNLYHILNHVNLFGRGYLRQANHLTNSLIAQLGPR